MQHALSLFEPSKHAPTGSAYPMVFPADCQLSNGLVAPRTDDIRGKVEVAIDANLLAVSDVEHAYSDTLP